MVVCCQRFLKILLKRYYVCILKYNLLVCSRWSRMFWKKGGLCVGRLTRILEIFMLRKQIHNGNKILAVNFPLILNENIFYISEIWISTISVFWWDYSIYVFSLTLVYSYCSFMHKWHLSNVFTLRTVTGNSWHHVIWNKYYSNPEIRVKIEAWSLLILSVRSHVIYFLSTTMLSFKNFKCIKFFQWR